MTIYRVTEPMTVNVKSLGRDVPLSPERDLDDTFPVDAAVIDEWAHRGVVREVNPRQTPKPKK